MGLAIKSDIGISVFFVVAGLSLTRGKLWTAMRAAGEPLEVDQQPHDPLTEIQKTLIPF